MNNQDFTASFHVAEAPDAVFKTIKNVRTWWSGLFGEEIKEDEDGGFTFRAGCGMHYSRQEPVEMVPGRKVAWKVTDSKLTFLNDEQEWTGTTIGFELAPEGSGTRVTFTHAGLTPRLECFGECSGAWGRYLHERLEPLLNNDVTAA